MKYNFLMMFGLLIVGCQSQKSIYSKQYCKLERLQYQEITETVKRTVDGEVKGGVKANGQVVITDNVKLDTVKANLDAGRKVFVNTETKSVVRVSEQFYEDYTRSRTALCALIEGASNKDFRDAEFKKRVSNSYVDIVELFAGVSDGKKK